MEEVDTILIRQLRDYGCEIDDGKCSLKELDASEIINAVIICLKRLNESKGLDNDAIRTMGRYQESMNMATKYKVANLLAAGCSQTGYKGEIGYQTFMYGNENDLRKLLLFLLGRMSHDDHAVTATEPVSGVRDTLNEKIRKLPVSSLWLPLFSSSFDQAPPAWDTAVPGLICSLHSKSITTDRLPPNRRRYYNEHVRVPLNNPTALLELNAHEANPETRLLSASARVGKVSIEERTLPVHQQEKPIAEIEGLTEQKAPEPAPRRKSMAVDEETVVAGLQQELQQLETNIAEKLLIQKQLEELKETVIHEKEVMKEYEACQLSIEELTAAINGVKSDMETITDKWDQMAKELTQEIKEARAAQQSTKSASKLAQLQKQMNETRKQIAVKKQDLHSKEAVYQDLMAKISGIKELPPTRSSYTKRILEICNNVKKQNQETRKTIQETRELQKEINSLSGKLSRGFTVADEMIFRHAKTSEFNRKCYKLLAAMQENWDQLLEGLQTIGALNRECRALEENIETEKSRKNDANLVRIEADLNQIKLENQHLVVKLKTIQSKE